MDRTFLLVHAAVTWALVGLIWTVQLVQYPLFSRIGADAFVAYHQHYSARITWVVGPLMLAELATAMLLVYRPPAGVPSAPAWLGLGLVVLIWLSTALLQVPQHNVLSGGFDAEAHRLLVASNWLRTFLWTARGGLVLWLLYLVGRSPAA